ncbi:hypothetical protein HanPI659440_Chr15g0603991 [Helianthus annuus]|nr:hypothetical protein HanPI659440_Chr15g0603991 [Helianthus annuus]
MSNQKVVQTETESDDENNPIHHPYAFHVSGPRKVSAPNWRDLINSSWVVPENAKTLVEPVRVEKKWALNLNLLYIKKYKK